MLRVTVPLGDRSYDAVVGDGAIAELDAMLPPTASRVAIVTQEGIPLDVDAVGPLGRDLRDRRG